MEFDGIFVCASPTAEETPTTMRVTKRNGSFEPVDIQDRQSRFALRYN